MKRLVTLSLLLHLTACGGSGNGGDASTPDASMSDGAADAADAEADAAPVACSTEGEVRSIACGNCGTAEETCEAGAWVGGACGAEGECLPGALEDETLANCSTQSRSCTPECNWRDWTPAGEAGECEVGAIRDVVDSCGVATVQPQVCNDSCAWDSAGACVSVCGDLRTSPVQAEELCVPAGDFIRGDAIEFGTSPVTTVFVSEFAMQRYPVTNTRYLACRMADGCPGTIDDFAEVRLADMSLRDHAVVGVTWAQAVEFCAWDGGRRLPTEAELEKAGRGPAPRTNSRPWDGDFRCDLLPVFGCPGVDGASIPLSDPVDAFPGAASFYGIEGLFGATEEWAADWFLDSYYAMPGSLTDPTGPATGTRRSIRGLSRVNGLMEYTLAVRSSQLPANPWGGMRCVRSTGATP